MDFGMLIGHGSQVVSVALLAGIFYRFGRLEGVLRAHGERLARLEALFPRGILTGGD